MTGTRCSRCSASDTRSEGGSALGTRHSLGGVTNTRRSWCSALAGGAQHSPVVLGARRWCSVLADGARHPPMAPSTHEMVGRVRVRYENVVGAGWCRKWWADAWSGAKRGGRGVRCEVVGVCGAEMGCETVDVCMRGQVRRKEMEWWNEPRPLVSNKMNNKLKDRTCYPCKCSTSTN